MLENGVGVSLEIRDTRAYASYSDELTIWTTVLLFLWGDMSYRYMWVSVGLIYKSQVKVPSGLNLISRSRTQVCLDDVMTYPLSYQIIYNGRRLGMMSSKKTCGPEQGFGVLANQL